MKRGISLSVFLVLLFASSASIRQTNASIVQSMTAQQILAQMMTTYVSCKSYLDTGEVRTVYLDARGRRTVVLPFSTAFIRPSSFRFEFRSRRGEAEWEQYIIWKQDDAVKSWWSIRPGIMTDRSFSMSVSGATGVSGKSSLTVPSMLMPDELRANPLKALTNLNLVGEEKIAGRDAFKIEGQDFRGNTTTLWIDKQRFLLLQIFEKRKISSTNGNADFETEATTVYDPQLNEDIPASKLAFDPPAQKH
jgi:outer membrane lipoprotein-sorting protein